MIEVVYRRALEARRLEAVLVATDDDRIVKAVSAAGGRAVITSAGLPSGTDRVAEAARDCEADIVVNLQGDEPMIRPEQIDSLVEAMEAFPDCALATLMTPFRDRESFASPDVVKVICDLKGYAIYFSRSPVPHGGREALEGRGNGVRGPFKHIGIYAYRKDVLLWMAATEPTPLERQERLEQLRAIEHGLKIRVVETSHDTVSVDRPEDIGIVEGLLASGR